MSIVTGSFAGLLFIQNCFTLWRVSFVIFQVYLNSCCTTKSVLFVTLRTESLSQTGYHLSDEMQSMQLKVCKLLKRACAFKTNCIFCALSSLTHICVRKLTIIGSDNGLSPAQRQAIIWTSAGILLIGALRTEFSETLIVIYAFSFKKMHLRISFGKW